MAYPIILSILYSTQLKKNLEDVWTVMCFNGWRKRLTKKSNWISIWFKISILIALRRLWTKMTRGITILMNLRSTSFLTMHSHWVSIWSSKRSSPPTSFCQWCTLQVMRRFICSTWYSMKVWNKLIIQHISCLKKCKKRWIQLTSMRVRQTLTFLVPHNLNLARRLRACSKIRWKLISSQTKYLRL